MSYIYKRMGCSGSNLQESKQANLNPNLKKLNSSKSSTSNTGNIQNIKLKNIYNNDRYDKHYRTIEKIGTGTFGKVYKVLHINSGQERALKIVSKCTIKYQDDEKEFLKEIELLSKLDHPSIIKVFEYFYTNENYYVIQEYCKGGELYEQIYRIESFTERIAAEIIFQLLSAVCYLHSNNIVHRDLKPENIMLESKRVGDYSIKLIDFGTANYCYPNTELYQKVGTSYYIAPEVVNKRYNNKCDIWSCGVILFILLCGYPPFDGESDEEIMKSVVKDDIIYEESEWKNISKGAKEFIKRLLTKDHTSRISAEECLKEEWLLKYTQHSGQATNPVNISSQMQNFQKFDSKLKLKNAILAFMVHHLATEEMTKELKLMFKKMDKSGDGRLSLEELKEGFREIQKHHPSKGNYMTDIEIDKRFNDIDSDKSGYIEVEEFITVTINEELLINEKNLRLTFDYFDKDRSGQLDSSEIEELLHLRSRDDSNKAIVKELITKYDTNNDGVLSFGEFKELIKNFNNSAVKGN